MCPQVRLQEPPMSPVLGEEASAKNVVSSGGGGKIVILSYYFTVRRFEIRYKPSVHTDWLTNWLSDITTCWAAFAAKNIKMKCWQYSYYFVNTKQRPENRKTCQLLLLVSALHWLCTPGYELGQAVTLNCTFAKFLWHSKRGQMDKCRYLVEYKI